MGVFFGTGLGAVLYAQESGGRASSIKTQQERAAAQQQADIAAGVQLVAGSEPFSTNFVTRVFEQAGPAVVYITTKTQGFDFFLRPAIQEGAGSGFILDQDGHILTNNHVVQNADSITVVLASGKSLPAKVVGSDISTDLALLKVDPGNEVLPAVKMGDSGKLGVGDWVIAIGNPYGFDRTVTFGVVSSNDRTIRAADQRTISGVIQTDAAINPGNSGGPLLNAAGEVIGITSAILSKSGGSEGIGLAIPINTAKEIVNDLIKYGRVLRPWLGVEVRELYPRLVRALGLSVREGLVVMEVYRNSPAAQGGILPPVERDKVFEFFIITAADRKPVSTYAGLLDIVRSKSIGEKLELKLMHLQGGRAEEKTLSVTLSPLPENAPLTGVI